MAQSKILVDTNAYLRLAQSVKPLLFAPFGTNEYCLYIISELNDELSNHRLATKFPWAAEAEYQLNRKHYPAISKKQKKSIQDTFEYIWDHVVSELLGPSRVDALYIAYALELDVPVITDDKDMIALADVFGAKAMRTLELLKLMLDAGHISIEKIRQMVSYWRHIKDTPGNLRKDYQRLFGAEPP